MNGGHSLSQAPSPAPSVSLSCGWNKLQLITLAVPMAAVVDESPFTVKLSDARQAHASREGQGLLPSGSPAISIAERKYSWWSQVVGRSWVRVRSLLSFLLPKFPAGGLF